jgi:hypothetical protein
MHCGFEAGQITGFKLNAGRYQTERVMALNSSQFSYQNE